MTAHPHPLPTRQAAPGFALVSALLFLLILTVLAVSMFRSSGTQGKIAGNTLEHQRATQSAESALRYAEWLLAQGNATEVQACSQLIDLPTTNVTPVVCLNPPVQPTVLPWTVGMRYTPKGMNVRAGGGVVPSQGSTPPDIYYNSGPTIYIYKMGVGGDGHTLYQITAAGYGGQPNSVSVMQSVVSVGN